MTGATSIGACVLLLGIALPFNAQGVIVIPPRALNPAQPPATVAAGPGHVMSYALVKNEDAYALRVIEAIECEFGRDRVTLFNACCAHSLAGDLTGFRSAAKQLASLGGDGLDAFDFASAVRSKVASFERQLGISTEDVLHSFGMEPPR